MVPAAALQHDRRPRSARRRAAALIGAAFLAAVLLPFAVPAHETLAATCGTGWHSRQTPPKSIRVLITQTGRVDVVPFRSYVAKVMASGEFPAWLPQPVLQAGAVAVKQYAWYYALKGHHRSTYRTRGGICYDVRNDTMDQLFNPAAHPTQKQQHAINVTWGQTVYKGGRFILTGYRAGDTSRCAADADGWRLYAKSMVDCARRGWGRQRIQLAYYAPKARFVWRGTPPPGAGDVTPPTISVPQVEPSPSAVLGDRVPVVVSWTGSDDESGIANFVLQRRVDNGRWQRVGLGSSTESSVGLSLSPDHTYRFRLTATDKAGNRTQVVAGPQLRPTLLQSGKATLKGSWTKATAKHASGGSTNRTDQAGATARLAFKGSGIAVVAPRGPREGRAQVKVDGVVVDIIDLRADRVQPRRVVFSTSWAQGGRHTIAITNLGKQHRPRIDLDAFIVLQ
jgi:Stage II sporulation protein